MTVYLKRYFHMFQVFCLLLRDLKDTVNIFCAQGDNVRLTCVIKPGSSICFYQMRRLAGVIL